MDNLVNLILKVSYRPSVLKFEVQQNMLLTPIGEPGGIPLQAQQPNNNEVGFFFEPAARRYFSKVINDGTVGVDKRYAYGTGSGSKTVQFYEREYETLEMPPCFEELGKHLAKRCQYVYKTKENIPSLIIWK